MNRRKRPGEAGVSDGRDSTVGVETGGGPGGGWRVATGDPSTEGGKGSTLVGVPSSPGNAPTGEGTGLGRSSGDTTGTGTDAEVVSSEPVRASSTPVPVPAECPSAVAVAAPPLLPSTPAAAKAKRPSESRSTSALSQGRSTEVLTRLQADADSSYRCITSRNGSPAAFRTSFSVSRTDRVANWELPPFPVLPSSQLAVTLKIRDGGANPPGRGGNGPAGDSSTDKLTSSSCTSTLAAITTAASVPGSGGGNAISGSLSPFEAGTRVAAGKTWSGAGKSSGTPTTRVTVAPAARTATAPPMAANTATRRRQGTPYLNPSAPVPRDRPACGGRRDRPRRPPAYFIRTIDGPAIIICGRSPSSFRNKGEGSIRATSDASGCRTMVCLRRNSGKHTPEAAEFLFSA